MWLMEAFYWSFRAPGRICSRLGIHPDVLTWISLVLSMATLPAAAMGHFSISGALLIVGSVFDALDGMVARDLKVASDSGEMLDAVVDRYADAAPLIGLAVFYRFSLWQMAIPIVCLMGSMMVSYVRAKTEALGLKLPSGLMRRHERIAYISCALVIAPELSDWLGKPAGAVHPGTLAVVGLVAVVSNYAAYRLVAAARNELIKQGRGPKGAIVQQ
jgi:CDP-diacylglycerol--glycerol-3-phosphate 3-phosphatidyltransferase